jgi:hypothetical protein
MTWKDDARDKEFQIQRARRSKAGTLSMPGGPSAPRRQGRTPQAVVKVAGWASTPSSVKRMLDYIARADKEDQELVALEAEDGITRKGQAEVDEVFNEWKPDFNRKSPQSQRSPRHAVHLVLSAKAEITSSNLKQTLEAARATAEKHFGEKGFKYALGVHRDGRYPHVHVVVKTTNTDRQAKKLRLGPAQLLEVRQTLAQELTNRGLAHVATREPARRKARHSNMKGPKPDTLNRVKIVLERMEKEQRQFERALSRSNPKVNVAKFQGQQAKALNTLREQAKNDSSLKDRDRLEAFNLIRRFSRDLEKKEIKPEVAITATVNYFDNKMKQLNKGFEKTHRKNTFGQMPIPHSYVAAVTEQGEVFQRELTQFLKEDLRKADIPIEAKKATFRQLRVHELAVKKINQKLLCRER